MHRLYTERKNEENFEVLSLLNEVKNIPGNENISRVRILNRYDIQPTKADKGLDDEILNQCKHAIFAEPYTDNIIASLR